jgi:hypothetical protein
MATLYRKGCIFNRHATLPVNRQPSAGSAAAWLTLACPALFLLYPATGIVTMPTTIRGFA